MVRYGDMNPAWSRLAIVTACEFLRYGVLDFGSHEFPAFGSTLANTSAATYDFINDVLAPRQLDAAGIFQAASHSSQGNMDCPARRYDWLIRPENNGPRCYRGSAAKPPNPAEMRICASFSSQLTTGYVFGP